LVVVNVEPLPLSNSKKIFSVEPPAKNEFDRIAGTN